MKKIIAFTVLIALACAASAYAAQVADSVTEFSFTQGMNNWYYGYTPVSSGVYDPSGFAQYTTYGGWGYWYESGSALLMWNKGGQASGTNNGGIKYSVRRWISTVSGSVQIQGAIAKLETFGDGVKGHVYVDGTEVWNSGLIYGTTTPVNYSFITNVNAGSMVDFALDPIDTDQNDAIEPFAGTISTSPVPEPATLLSLAMGMAFTGLRLKSKKR